MHNKSIFDVMEQGLQLLRKGEFGKAAAHFQKVIGLDPKNDPIARNNLGLALYHSGDPERALKSIEPNIEKSALPNPFGHSLAVQICVKLGNKKRAAYELGEALKDFEQGMSLYRNKAKVPEYWKEYALSILEAAGVLGEHRQAYSLYRRWENLLDSCQMKFIAGIAAFNLRKYRQAASCWASVTNNESISIHMQRIAIMADRGIVPPFQLPYKITGLGIDDIKVNVKDDAASLSSYVANSGVKLSALSVLFDPSQTAKNIDAAASILILYGKEWGMELGKELLMASTVSMDVKFAAARALIDLGVYRHDEKIPVLIDGAMSEIKISEVKVLDKNTKELDEAMQEVKKLFSKDKSEEAINLLNTVIAKGKVSADVLLFLSQLYYTMGDYEKSLQNLDLLDNIYLNHPSVLFNKALNYKEMGKNAEALELLDRIEEKRIKPEIKEQIQALRHALIISSGGFADDGLVLDPEYLLLQYGEKKRKEIEAKALPVDAPLVRGMKNMPAIWLEGACDYYGLPNYRTRKEREKALVEFITNQDNLKGVIEDLEDSEIELLKFLLVKGGWSAAGPIARKFGSTEGDGYFWNEEPPVSELGLLWSVCLVFVGKALINGRRTTIVTIPLELRENLDRLL
ncbi:MAG: tetratricopeptide repeat protein [Bacillota bacterium]